MMRALSLWQPWASLMAIGAKTIETRGWSTDYRGDLAIHATADNFDEQLCYDEPFFSVLRSANLVDHRPAFVSMPRGAIVAVVRLRDVKSTRWLDSLPRGGYPPFEWQFGNFEEGRYMWLTDSLRRLTTPVPCKGARQIWEVPSDVEQRVLADLAAGAARSERTAAGRG